MKSLKDLTSKLEEASDSQIKKEIDALKKKKTPEDDILQIIAKKYKNLSSFKILSLMESSLRIPLTAGLVPCYEKDGDWLEEENYIFVHDENSSMRYYFEGTSKFEFLGYIAESMDSVHKETHCDICKCDDHNTEDCTNIKEICDTHAKRIVEYCERVRHVIDPTFSNKQIVEFLREMNRVKQLGMYKTFIYEDKTYDINEQTNLLKVFLEDFSDKGVFGEANGKIYRATDELPKNCEYVKLSRFKRV